MVSDYFAELLVAGVLADNGWNVYFPHRDQGFDFIISKNIGGTEIIRPVQVKGKYPENQDKREPSYGYLGRLSKVHEDMILAIVYTHENVIGSYSLIALMPLSKVVKCNDGYKCLPAVRDKGKVSIKKGYQGFLIKSGK